MIISIHEDLFIYCFFLFLGLGRSLFPNNSINPSVNPEFNALSVVPKFVESKTCIICTSMTKNLNYDQGSDQGG